MFEWFKKNKNVPLKQERIPENIPEITSNEEELSVEIPDFISIKESEKGEVGVVFNSDGFSKKEAKELYQQFSEEMGIPFFEGKIEYGYDLDKVNSKEICPKCNEKLHQRYSNLIYSNGEDLRVSTSPFGYFCEACPTVVIDVRTLSNSLPDGISFYGIAGVDVSGKGLMLFELWNDEKPVFILDENKNMIGVTTKSEMMHSPELYEDYYQSWEDGGLKELPPSPSKIKKKSKSRKRNKSAKKSRRNNRRKK